LSKAGKEVLIKAVAQAILTYTMSRFYLTKSFYDDLSKMIARFWWSQQDKSNKNTLDRLGDLDETKVDGRFRVLRFAQFQYFHVG
jgi:hypothetical protein